ncbi:hypothetical protein GCM10022276_27000 [Sphingomonas limnosediminicola]|jgi:hypothetical protein|uniref:Uncharacterized protein n=1 Tax=Sphingomonas limnosediminicola TaxID=940133 RepID=A0ABP7LTM0_9SPHN
MLLARPARSINPRRFGRGPVKDAGPAPTPAKISDDLKLFATTFAAGFVFVSVFFG